MPSRPPSRYFLVERYLPSVGPADVAPAVARLGGGEGSTRHLCSIHVVEEETCLSVFEAPDAAAVAAANSQARFGLDRIVEVAVYHGPDGRRRAQ